MKILILVLISSILFKQTKAGFRDGPTEITSSVKYANSPNNPTVLLYFDYANIDKKIRKPLIVFEGYDPGYYTKPKEKEGRTGIQKFIDDIIDDRSTNAPTPLELLLQGNDNVSPAIIQQYDIIYVNWKNGTDYIQNNVLVAIDVINWVNQQKITSGSNQPNVILGKSMGSIVARMALKTMENNHAAYSVYPLHNTRLFISAEGGQQGSNIPQGYQHLGNHFRDLYIETGPVFSATETIALTHWIGSPLASLSVNETPASRQLIINHVNLGNDVDPSLHNSFMAELRLLGYPQGDGGTPFKKVAISNGSECAKPQPCGSGGNLFTWKGSANTSLFSDVSGLSGAMITGVGTVATQFFPPLFILGTLPGRNKFDVDFAINAKADNIGNQIYKGKITYTKKVLFLIPITITLTNRSYNANASTLAYDYFPGGFQDLAGELPLPLGHGPLEPFFIQNNITLNHQQFCHVPVPSALDIGSGTVALTYADYFTPYKGSSPPTGTKSTPFTNGFITAFNGSPDNEPHTSIERRNGDWLANKLDGGTTQPVSCEWQCNGATITGTDMLCTSQSQYTIPGFPATGASVVWQSSNNSIATVSSTGLLTKGAGNGAITLTATITACGRDLVIYKPVFVGTPDPSKFIIYNDQPCAGYPVGFGAYYEEATFCSLNRAKATNVEWEVVSPYSYQLNPNSGMGYCDAGNINNSGVTINFYRSFSSYTAQVRFRALNACGWSGWSSYKTLTVQPCGSGLMAKITPNPATGTATIAVEEMAAAKTAGIEKSGITQIKVVDKSGNIKLVKSFAKGLKQVQLNTSGLPSDIYSVHILYGKEWTVQKLMVQH